MQDAYVQYLSQDANGALASFLEDASTSVLTVSTSLLLNITYKPVGVMHLRVNPTPQIPRNTRLCSRQVCQA
jgi:hypothetical protein